ncbi:ABC transporter ATP-binding protein [Kushneria pakistanensis]|uniref:ABC transporter ATP-binding protein n=2 Tax=Kushneria pakistanensis TaxID=1508770 RepID=A0ABQ3FGE6_9GAMM|nr:ABC transporter ATP-binding protein [Kushneria pakistanensis]
MTALAKHFGQHVALEGLSMTIEPGEFVALLGPSGCGKSTTLRLLAGFETPDHGEIYLGDQRLSSAQMQVPPEQRRMGMVFQSYALWPHLSVAGNVDYPLRVQKVASSERRRRVEAVLARVDMTAMAGRYPRELSGGQRQRVALARCLVSQPAVILLDEPLANLDRHLRASMEDYFRDFHRETGTTMVYVTHDQDEAMALADRVAVMQAGRLKQFATPETLYHQPVDVDVARFIGQGSIVHLTRAAAGEWLTGSEAQRLSDQGRARGFVRPQHVVTGVEGGLPAQVERCIFRGERHVLSLRLADGQSLTAYSAAAQPSGSRTGVAIERLWGLEAGEREVKGADARASAG